jgi:hypothetical protein
MSIRKVLVIGDSMLNNIEPSEHIYKVWKK